MISATSSANIIHLSTTTFECDGDKIIQVPPGREKHIMHEIMEEVFKNHYSVEDRTGMLMMMSFFSTLNFPFHIEMAI